MAVVSKGDEGKNLMADDDDRSKERAEREDHEEVLDYKGPTPPGGGAVATGGGFMSIYKSGQGYWTRMGTAGGIIALLFFTCQFIYSTVRFRFNLEPSKATLWASITASAVGLVGAILAWWYLNKPRVADFLIATESEMKKVNWTSRKDLIGSTRVVIIFMLLISFFLFMIDILFGYFFQLINVLKHGPFE